MGFIESTKNYIKKAVNYISGNSDTKISDAKNNAQTKKASTTPVSVVRPDGKTVGNVGDEVVISQNTKAQESTKTQQASNKSNTKAQKNSTKNKTKNGRSQADVNKKMAEVEAKCNKLGINIKTILAGMRYSKNLSLDEQYRKLYVVNAALSLPAALKKSNKTKVEKTALITEVAKTYDSAMTEGGIKDINKLQATVAEATDKALEINSADGQTEKEKIESLTQFGDDLVDSINNTIKDEQKGLSASERAKLEKQNKARIRHTRKAVSYGFIAAANPEERKLAACIADGKDLAEVTKATIDFSKDEDKATVAGSETLEFFNNVTEAKYKHGDDVPADVYGSAIEYSMQYKSAEDAIKFEQDAYEFRQKVENGEIDAPWITKEHLTEQTAAIGKGIAANNNLTTEQKANLLKTWDSHAKNFNDYEKVNQKFNENNQNRENVKNVVNTSVGSESKQNETSVKIENHKASKKELEEALSELSFAVVKRKYPQNSDRELVTTILHNPKLKSHKSEIIHYLKAYSAEDLYSVTKGCNTEMFCFVLRNISPEKAGKLYDLSKSDKCYATRKLGEKIVEESKNNEAV